MAEELKDEEKEFCWSCGQRGYYIGGRLWDCNICDVRWSQVNYKTTSLAKQWGVEDIDFSEEGAPSCP